MPQALVRCEHCGAIRGGPPGESHPNAKLTNEQVLDIRRRSADGETAGELARSYEVGVNSIRHIIKRRTWKHI